MPEVGISRRMALLSGAVPALAFLLGGKSADANSTTSLVTSRREKSRTPVRFEKITVAFDTPNIQASEGGVPFFTGAAGESFTDDPSPSIITSPFNGASPTFAVFAQGDDPTDTNTWLTILGVAGKDMTAIGSKATRIFSGSSNFGSTGLPAILTGDTLLMIALTDGSGDDDDSTTGSAHLVLPVWSAAS